MGMVLIAVPCAPGAQLMQRGNAVPEAGAAVPAQQPAAAARVLTLDEALELAEPKSEQVTIAAAGVTRAESQEQRVRSEWLPQVSAVAAYDRALASEFSGLFDTSGPSCIPFTVNPDAPLQDRVGEIERALRDCPPAGNAFGGGDTTDDDLSLPFGQPNTYRVNLAFSQNVYTGGRLQAQQAQARLGRENAGLALTSTRAQLALDVSQAYFDAVLADRLVDDRRRDARAGRANRRSGAAAARGGTHGGVRSAARAGGARHRAARGDPPCATSAISSYLRLKQLLDLPLDHADAARLHARRGRAAAAGRAVGQRDCRRRSRNRRPARPHRGDAGRQRRAAARSRVIRVARSQRLPTVSVSSAYGRVAYSGRAALRRVPHQLDDRRGCVGADLHRRPDQGGRADGARANLVESQARLQLTQELAALDEASTRLELTNARAAWESTAGIVQQAQRAYEIAELRYREGLSTQLELSDARLLLQQAQNQRAVAARTVQLARVRLALLPDLPLSAASSPAAAVQGAGVTQQQAPVTPPAARPRQRRQRAQDRNETTEFASRRIASVLHGFKTHSRFDRLAVRQSRDASGAQRRATATAFRLKPEARREPKHA